MMPLLCSLGGNGRSVLVRKTPSRGSVGLNVGLLMITGNGNVSLPRSGKSQNNRGTSEPSGRMRIPSLVCFTGMAIVVRSLLSTATEETSMEDTATDEELALHIEREVDPA